MVCILCYGTLATPGGSTPQSQRRLCFATQYALFSIAWQPGDSSRDAYHMKSSNSTPCLARNTYSTGRRAMSSFPSSRRPWTFWGVVNPIETTMNMSWCFACQLSSFVRRREFRYALFKAVDEFLL